MDINATASDSALVSNTQPQPPAPRSEKQPQEQQDSAVVKLSEQAQQMSRAETRTKETAGPSGIQFMEGESKGGHVNTYA